MAIIRVNAHHDTCRLHGSAQSLGRTLSRAVQGNGPVVILIPGFSYQPGHRQHCPHRQVLSVSGQIAPSWPRGFGFGDGAAQEGLAVAFGWNARGSIWGARRRADAAGRALATLVSDLHHRAPHCRLHIVAHSMGIEVAASALTHLQTGSVNRIISMTGAAYQSAVLAALATPAGQSVEFFNVISHANALYDQLYERLIVAPVRGDRTLGHGLNAPNALTLQLDCAITLQHLARLGTPVTAPTRRHCHWSSYTRPGALDCYRAWLRDPDQHSLTRLRRGLPRLTAPQNPLTTDATRSPLPLAELIRRAALPGPPAQPG